MVELMAKRGIDKFLSTRLMAAPVSEKISLTNF